MAVKVCVDASMISTVSGMGMRRNWLPRPVAEVFLESVKDGEAARAPDPVTMIEGDLSYFNNSGDAQHLRVEVWRAPRSMVTQSPGTVVMHDAWSWSVGASPAADYPSVVQDSFGGRAQVDRPEVEADKLAYGRLFLDCDSSQTSVPIGVLAPRESLHFRYLCAIQTPGTWTTPSEFEPRWEAKAQWARLLAYAAPVGSA